MEPKIRIYCIYSVKLEWRPRRGGTVLASCYSLSSRSITMFLVIPRAAFFISFILASNKGNEPWRITILENGFVPSLSHVIILLGIKRCFSCKSKKKEDNKLSVTFRVSEMLSYIFCARYFNVVSHDQIEGRPGVQDFRIVTSVIWPASCSVHPRALPFRSSK
jgi:hypothetical protein